MTEPAASSTTALARGQGMLGSTEDLASRPRAARVATRAGCRALRQRPWLREALIVVAYLIVGAAVTWPLPADLIGRIPFGEDQAQTVWNFWWVTHQLTHLHSVWNTTYLAAPVGAQLGYDTFSPLLGVLMTPVTLGFGPSASAAVLTLVTPGLAAYAMYRVARLWLPTRLGAISSGALFGFSAMFVSQSWLHLHTAAGVILLPVTLEAAVRLRRSATAGRGVVLGVVLGAALLIDQESALMAVILAALIVVPWLFRGISAKGIGSLALGAVVAVVVASPELVAMLAESGRNAPTKPPSHDYVNYGASPLGLFMPGPHIVAFLSKPQTTHEMVTTFGVMLTILGVVGLVVGWSRRGTRKLGLLWAGAALLALGPTIHHAVPLAASFRGERMSLLMPYTWMIKLPGLSSFREADRLAFLGLVAAALLAGAGVEWLRRQSVPLLAGVAVLAAVEAGWAGSPGQTTVPTTLPTLDRPIAADHSGSIVVDVPFVIRGPQRYGAFLSPYALMLATSDGHPRAAAYMAGVPSSTIRDISRHAFYAALVAAQSGLPVTPTQLSAARADLRTMHIGWVLVWTQRWDAIGATNPVNTPIHYSQVERYLARTGFSFSYRADGVLVYRPTG